MKKIIAVIICCLLSISLFSCSNSTNLNDDKQIDNKKIGTNQGTKNEKRDSKKNIALVMKTLTNPFFIDMEKGARKAESELGINLIVRTGAQETSIEQQINIVDELINSKVDAIVIAPGSSTELIPVLKKAQDAGIPIVNIDNRLELEESKKAGLLNVPFISVDNENAAYLSAKYISDKITKPAKAAIIEGIMAADNSKQRKNGALKAFKENSNITIVALKTANWKIDEAYKVTSDIFSKYPDLGAVFCANDMMALGAVEYIIKNDKKNVLVAGFDALAEAKEAIDQGKMQVTIDQQADIQGYKGVMYAVQILKHENVPMETMIPVKVINRDNIN